MPAARLPHFFLLCFVAILAAAQSQPASAGSALAAFPDCARPCITDAFIGGLCAPTDQECICSDKIFQQNVTLCVSAECSVPDALATRNTSLTNCGAPVRDRSGEYVVLSNTMVVVAAVCVIIRLSYKIFSGLELGLDDWLILVTIISAIPSAVITVRGAAPNGLGKDIWTLTPVEITNVLFYFYHMAYLYFLLVALVKLSIISFYIRIFPGRAVQRLLWGTFVFTIVWALTFIFTVILQCQPISYFWTQWERTHNGRCASASRISWSHASLNIALDLWVLAIPLWQLKGLHLHWKKKLGVAIMFGVGTFVTVISILRLQSLIHFASTSNTSWEFFDISMWSTIEVLVGVVCACLPAIRMVLVRAFPILGGGSSLRSKGNKYYQQDAGEPHSKITGVGVLVPRMGKQQGTVGVVTTERRDSDPEASVEGIVLHKTYEVQYSNEDETRLVPMRKLDHAGRTVDK
ncbi:CFEM domain-containing protein [Paramyrothecium foliicola]|nr:CFEM domain-containing protein [Paramyrothecium foliicola]